MEHRIIHAVGYAVARDCDPQPCAKDVTHWHQRGPQVNAVFVEGPALHGAQRSLRRLRLRGQMAKVAPSPPKTNGKAVTAHHVHLGRDDRRTHHVHSLVAAFRNFGG